MRPHRFLSNHTVTLTVLIAIMMRASVATGWMLQIPSGDGLATPVLAICPQQSPTLAAWLTNEQTAHTHHQHGGDGQPTDVSLTVADPACALWAGSATASANGIPGMLALAPGSTAPAVAQKPAPQRTFPSAHRARAPPALQSV